MAMDAADVVIVPRKLFFRDGLREWGKAFAVGLPAGEADGVPVVDTGRARVRLTPAAYESWLAAHEKPVSLDQAAAIIRSMADDGEDADDAAVGAVVRRFFEAGLFAVWPLSLGEGERPENFVLGPKPGSESNPFAPALPDEIWRRGIRLDVLGSCLALARQDDPTVLGLFDVVEVLLRAGVAWLVRAV